MSSALCLASVAVVHRMHHRLEHGFPGKRTRRAFLTLNRTQPSLTRLFASEWFSTFDIFPVVNLSRERELSSVQFLPIEVSVTRNFPLSIFYPLA